MADKQDRSVSGSRGPLVLAGLGLLAIYRVLLSPLLGGTCRFTPSCSEYAEQALRRHGAWRGGLLTVARLARCHPFGGRGFDPVPDAPVHSSARRPRPGPDVGQDAPRSS